MESITYPDWYIEVKNICPNRTTEDFLDFMGITLTDCKWKNITSIWWWFGIFEMDACKAWSNITIVDPLFTDTKNISLKIQENYNRLNKVKLACTTTKSAEHMSKTINEISQQLKELLLNRSSSEVSQSQINKLKSDLQRRIKRKDELEKRTKKLQTLLDHLLSRENNYKANNLILNSSAWNHITGIWEWTQDLVLINHTLSHIYKNFSLEDIKQTLSEWYKLLYDNWKLWIIDYKQDMQPIETWLQDKNASRYKTNYWSFSYRFDKQSLKEFINEYF